MISKKTPLISGDCFNFLQVKHTLDIQGLLDNPVVKYQEYLEHAKCLMQLMFLTNRITNTRKLQLIK